MQQSFLNLTTALSGVALVGAGAFFALLTAQVIHVWITFFRANSRMADEALRRGASLRSWRDPSLADRPTGAQDKYRKGRAGRWVPDIGVVAVDQYVANHIPPK